MQSILVVAILICSLQVVHAKTIPDDLALSEYVHTEWTQHDGIPLGRVERILQTGDGYLWIVTRDEGLFRFDGMRFVAPVTPCKVPVRTAASSPDGGFWAICGAQLIRRTSNGDFVEIQQNFLLPNPPPSPGLLVDKTGRPWFFGDTLRYLETDGSAGAETERRISGAIRTAAVEEDGTMWVSDTDQVVHLIDGRAEATELKNVWCLKSAKGRGVFALADGRIWLLRAGSVPQEIGVAPEQSFTAAPGCMAEASNGDLWIGSRQHGIGLLRRGQFETLPYINQSNRFTEYVFLDREGTIWVGSVGGLHRFREPIAQFIPRLSEHLKSSPAFVFVDSKDNIWLSPGDQDGVSRLDVRTQKWTSVAKHEHVYWGIGEDDTGRIWLSNTKDIGYISNGSFVPVRDDDNKSITAVLSFKRDSKGNLLAVATGVGVYSVAPGLPRLLVPSPNADEDFLASDKFGIWAGIKSGGVAQHVDGRVNIFPGEQYPSIDNKTRTIIQVDDSIWIATFRALRRWRNGVWTTWTTEQGLPNQGRLEDIIPDRLGNLWLLGSGGLLMLPRTQLDNTPDGSPHTLSFARISALDGVVPHPGGTSASPRATSDSQGRLYFATMDSVVIVDPSVVVESTVPPTIALESVAIDNQSVDIRNTNTFVEPVLIRFDYTSLSLRSPETARFRYRLQGYDNEWIEAGTGRNATYASLPPGNYVFTVIGASGLGVWNEEGRSYAFHITPVIWRTWWFQAGLGMLVLLVVVGLYRLRIEQLTQRLNHGLEERVNERTRIARELHDTFLQTVNGSRLVADHALRHSDDHSRMIAALGQLSQWLSQASEEGRAALNSLRASATERNDLAEGFRRAIEECRLTSSSEISFSVNGSSKETHPFVRDEIYRIGYEAIRNSCVHSRADRVSVKLDYGNDLTLRIGDDGVGIDSLIIEKGVEGHFGLSGMRERAERIGSKLTIDSPPNSGTLITLRVPGRIAFHTTKLSLLGRIRSLFQGN